MIGVTMGDPNGIGPEVTLKAIKELKLKDIVIIGSKKVIESTRERLNIDGDVEVNDCVDVNEVAPGKISKLAGLAAYHSIIKGYELIKERRIDALVTAPVCKEAINLAGIKFQGHTELLAELSGTKKFAMLLMGEKIRVILVTTHIPLKEVPSSINKDIVLEKIIITDKFWVKYFNKKPKIIVSAINPHAEFGDEEKNIITPAIEEAKILGIDADGPFPADTLCERKFDVIINMYHDQGLILLKAKEFNTAVNITIGLPFIRVSPAHGTGFDIAGKGIANPNSMINAIIWANRLYETSRS